MARQQNTKEEKAARFEVDSFFFLPVAGSSSHLRYNVPLPLKKTCDLVSYMLGNSPDKGIASPGCYLNGGTVRSSQPTEGRLPT